MTPKHSSDSVTHPRFVIGIDLGTTNSALAYIDSNDPGMAVENFPIPQLVAPATVQSRDVLPSFHYERAAGELSNGAIRLPWSGSDDDPRTVVGAFARDHGSAVPGRMVASAKSWLSHRGVDRTAGLLPWHGAADVERLSPVEASARYLAHLRAAWDSAHREYPLKEQTVVLTVPASFDEVARELTIEAAKLAGLNRILLLEEPQAAFYAWIDAHRDDWQRRVEPGQTILVCDVGGGTSDFTLIRVKPAESNSDGPKVFFHRVAVGEHLILGGDNLDLAIAHHLESQFAGASGQRKLPASQFASLLRQSRQLKETLLGVDPPDSLTLSISSPGAKLIGGARQLHVTRDQIQQLLLEGFLPRAPLDAKPMLRRSGFQEFGLPYAPDPAITRYLAAFLTAHRDPNSNLDAARPDLILFNGGLFESPVLRERLLDVLTSWFSTTEANWRPIVLHYARLDLAVARGAAYYGMVRRGVGVRISGGLAHSYYIGVETGDGGSAAVCLLPAGVEEGQTIELDRTFELLIRQPVEFLLYVSSTRTTDPPGAMIPVDREQLTPLPPIRTVLHSSRQSAAGTIPVRLHATLNEIGTLEVGCREVQGERRWKLQFDVRSASHTDIAAHQGQAESQGVVDEEVIARCRDLIQSTFGPANDPAHPPGPLIKRLEEIITTPRAEWPASLMRSLWETLMEVEAARRHSIEHEARWLNLTGFCLRPGYGLAVDDWRVGQTWTLHNEKLMNPRNELCRAEWWVLWRRIAGGLTRGQQQTLADPLLAAWRTYIRKSGSNIRWNSPTFQFGPHESAEVWRALGALELIKPASKIELAILFLEIAPRKQTAPFREAGYTALGRLGSRVPMYGPLNDVVASEIAEQWAGRIVESNPSDERALLAVVQLTRRTGDRYRDISEPMRQKVLDWLASRSALPHYIDLVREGGVLAAEEERIVLGDSLPRGLALNSLQ